MTPRPPEMVSAAMRRVHSSHTSPELALRRALWSRGLRYRLHRSDLPGRPDIVFPAQKVAIFVDGDFWHGRQWQVRGFTSLQEQMGRLNNPAYWIKKLSRNVERDRLHDAQLCSRGWTVIRVWESNMRKNLPQVVETIVQALKGPKLGN
jgi:DNA mismatch endonuclease, patch repair protein